LNIPPTSPPTIDLFSTKRTGGRVESHPTPIPSAVQVIVEKAEKSDIPDLDKKK
jgi:hypothetical protein